MAAGQSRGWDGWLCGGLVCIADQPDPAGGSPAPALPTYSRLVVNTTSAGVALRSAPLVSDATLIKYLPLGAQLQVMEDGTVAQSKVGVLNQWLQVQDITGTVGLVAGSCVALSTGQAALGRSRKPPRPLSRLRILPITVLSAGYPGWPGITQRACHHG